MQQVRSRLSPALVVAFIALFTALCGTALAQSGILVSSPAQIAPDILNGNHVKNESLSNIDMRDPHLKVRVAKDGTRIGSGDGTVTRAPNAAKGVYDVTFNEGILNGFDGTTEDSMITENCAITATSRAGSGTFDAFAAMYLVRTTGPNTVRVSATVPGATGSVLTDTGFDVTAAC